MGVTLTGLHHRVTREKHPSPLRRCRGVKGLLLAAALSACVAPATAPPAAPSSSAAMTAPTSAPTVTPTPLVTAVPATPTVVPTSSIVATSSPTAQPTPAAPASRTPDVIGPIRNEGQKIIASVDALDWTIGEGGGSPATNVANYALNGQSLAGSAMRCASYQPPGGCSVVEFIPNVTLVNGVTYELTLQGNPLGGFIARGLVVATPHVVSMKATQFALTVTFDRPMLHVGDCGSYGWNFQTPGTIEHVRAASTGFPANVGSYATSSAAYRDFFTAFVSQADVSADCRTVTLGSGWGAPTGTFDVTVSGVKDIDGNLVVPRTMSVSITDEAPPKLMFAQLELQTAENKVIRVAYSEAMDEEYVTDAQRYYLNGKLVPAGTRIECALASCTWVRLTFAPTAFTYGASNTLTVIGVRDTAGKAMDPDIVTSAPFQVF